MDLSFGWVHFHFKGHRKYFLINISFFDEILLAHDWMPFFAASHLGLFCLPRPHTNDAMLNFSIFEPRCEKPTFWFSTWSDTNQAVQL